MLGVLEKTFFVAEYAVVNTQGMPCGCEGVMGDASESVRGEGVLGVAHEVVVGGRGGKVLVRVWWEVGEGR